MGAVFKARIYPNLDKQRLMAAIEADIQRDAQQDGSFYSGSWGSCPHHIQIHGFKAFPSRFIARDHIESHEAANEGLIAVPYLKISDHDAVKNALSKVEISKQYNDIAREKRELCNQVAQRVRESSGVFKTCSQCKSKIATAYLMGASCPVCAFKHFAFNAPEIKTVERLEAQSKVLNEALRKIHEDADNPPVPMDLVSKDNIHWMVGAWCQH